MNYQGVLGFRVFQSGFGVPGLARGLFLRAMPSWLNPGDE